MTVIIPGSNLVAQYQSLQREIDAAVLRVLASGNYTASEEIDAFEEEFAAFVGVKHAIAVSSGTVACFFAAVAAGVQTGDEVITVPNTHVAPAAAITHAGARNVFVDIDPCTFNMDPRLVEAAITPRTSAIFVVHLYGLPAEMNPILEIAKRRSLTVIEDACPALGATYHGRKVGTLGQVAAFSFAARKILGGIGSGGMIVTNDAEIARKARLLRGYGYYKDQFPYGATSETLVDKHYHHIAEGYHLQLPAIQAAVLRVKLPRVPLFLERRRALALRYNAILARTTLITPFELPGMAHAYQSYIVRVPNRDYVQQEMERAGISTGTPYAPPLHLQPAYQYLGYGTGDFPVAEKAGTELLSLPLYAELSDEQADRVGRTLRQVVSSGSTSH
jgi:dTDP-4-amino-4,6-dideoxygalactose transaminase